jgi:hypothetical protein
MILAHAVSELWPKRCKKSWLGVDEKKLQVDFFVLGMGSEGGDGHMYVLGHFYWKTTICISRS